MRDRFRTHKRMRLALVNPKKQRKRNYVNSGELEIFDLEMTEVPSFLDYLRGGCELNLVVAIDYSASNGDPQYPFSLHSIVSEEPNEYTKAIQAIGNVLEDYDSDKLFPVRSRTLIFVPHGRDEAY